MNSAVQSRPYVRRLSSHSSPWRSSRRRPRGCCSRPSRSASRTLAHTVSANMLPTWQINGVVWSQAIVGNTVYVTGSFTKARPPGVAVGGPGEVPANNIFAFDLTRVTGSRRSTTVSMPRAWWSTASPDGSRIYVGGDFTTVDGIPHGHVAAFSTARQLALHRLGAQRRRPGARLRRHLRHRLRRRELPVGQRRPQVVPGRVRRLQRRDDPWSPTAEGDGATSGR